MSLLFKKYKTIFRYALQPVFAMLEAKHKSMSSDEWELSVERTHANILKNPAEFLGTDLPEENLLKDIIDEIFLEFYKDRKLRGKLSE